MVAYETVMIFPRELRACKETRSYVEKLQAEYDAALHRNSAIPKGKHAEAEEAMNAVATARTNFRSGAVDIVYQLTCFQQRKRFEILDNVSLEKWPEELSNFGFQLY